MQRKENPGIKVTDYIIDHLLKAGITQGFFMSGGMIAPIADACYRKGFGLFTMHHEQAAAFAAEAQATVTKKIGVAMATSGPGATNLVTGIGSAYFSSNPVLFITGQVQNSEINTGGKRRQVGFQETDIVSIVSKITKYSRLVKSPDAIAYELEKALFTATEGRMGPVLLDIPFDVQLSDVAPESLAHFLGSEEHARLSQKAKPDEAVLSEVAKMFADSKRPLILIGHGVRLSNAEPEVLKLVEKANVPFVTSLLGTDVIPTVHPLCYGFIGTYGQRPANFATANADLLLVLGSRLDVRQIGPRSGFAQAAKIIHVDIDQSELNASVNEDVSVEMDISDFVNALLPLLARKELGEWLSFLDGLKIRYKGPEQRVRTNEIDPIKAIRLLSDRYGSDGIVAVDVGSHQLWFGQGWETKEGQTVMTNGGMGPMGFSLPAAVGASIATGRREVLVVTGDGGLQVNIQEMQTVARNKLPVKIAVFDNNALILVTQFQSDFLGGRNIGSLPTGGYDSPDFVKVARAYGFSAEYANTSGELEEKIGWLVRQKGASLLQIKVPQEYWVVPKTKSGSPMHDMSPRLDKGEYASAVKYAKGMK